MGAAAAAVLLAAQQSDVVIKLTKGDKVAIAVPDLRGAGEAQQYMNVFNETLWSDLESSGLFYLVPKSMYPLQVAQRPEDFRQPVPAARGGKPVSQGPWLTDWSDPPVKANYATLGYTAAENGQIVLRGWLYNVAQPTLTGAQIFGKVYLQPLGEEGARKVAHDFASDILKQFGGVSLEGTKIYFVRGNGRGIKEIWSMDPDGANQKPITTYGSLSLHPAVSRDDTKLAFTTYAKGNPGIFVFSLETGRRLSFYNVVSPAVATPEFTPDGSQILYSASLGGWMQICIANLDGSNMRRLTYSRSIDMDPKVNPKTGAEIVFISGRSGMPQLYRMTMEGTDARLVTTGEGEVANPSWHPDGQHVAFSWTRGFAPGNYNIFVMDVANRNNLVQLTFGAGRNEHPSWAPDGRHLVFSSTRSGSNQIWTMLADGTQLKQLTTQGVNEMPVWGK